MQQSHDGQNQVKSLIEERDRLRAEVSRLRSLPGMPPVDAAPAAPPVIAAPPTPPAGVDASSRPAPVGPPCEPAPAHLTEGTTFSRRSPVAAKIALFRSLFRGRDDVYALRWERRDGKAAGYSPACRNAWIPDLCAKPKGKCTNCDYIPLTDRAIHDHLTGAETVGLYPLRLDETCWFLAVDFDKGTWQADTLAFLQSCDDLGVSAVLERSRSGNGGHAWVFFTEPLAADQARKLGSSILTRTMDRRHEIGLRSYDRLFPNQDTLPKGGFGNLIALPLQKRPRAEGNSVFVDRSLVPYPDQWAFLSGVRRMRPAEVDAIVQAAARSDSIIGVRLSLTGDESEAPWTLLPSGRSPHKLVPGPLPKVVRFVSSNQIFVEKAGLPPALLNRLIRLAAFQNPEFYRAQKMRLSTFGKPRVIGVAEDFPLHIGLPRGCLEPAAALMQDHGIRVEMSDERFPGTPLPTAFRGELTPPQRAALAALSTHDIGILSAGTAFGKTVVAAALIAARQVNTLVLVHRRQLLDQWRERLASFLNLPPQAIGQLGAGKAKPSGLVDVGILQSLCHKGEVNDVVANYGQVIVDECHHLPAVSFAQVLKQVKARYVIGLTATPYRKDGHHPIIQMQCGPIRFQVGAKQQAAARPFDHMAIPRHTAFREPADGGDLGIQALYTALAADDTRNAAIVADVISAVRAGRSPLVLTERTAHLDELARLLRNQVRHLVQLRGGMGTKARRSASAELAAIPEDEERVLVATGRYAGEGFDDARLDTLFLAMPIAWKGTLNQYAGRLHRLHHAKRTVQIYDYVDANVPVLARMFDKRVQGYKAIGYSVAGHAEIGDETARSNQARLPADEL